MLEKFGTVLTEEEITKHIQDRFKDPLHEKLPAVIVEQIVIGPLENEQGQSRTVGVQTTHRYTIANPALKASAN